LEVQTRMASSGKFASASASGLRKLYESMTGQPATSNLHFVIFSCIDTSIDGEFRRIVEYQLYPSIYVLCNLLGLYKTKILSPARSASRLDSLPIGGSITELVQSYRRIASMRTHNLQCTCPVYNCEYDRL
jgi:hypothetical protein